MSSRRCGSSGAPIREFTNSYSATLYARTWQDITHPEDIAPDQSLADDVITRKIAHYTLEKRYLRRDGRPVWVNLFGNFVFDDRGTPVQGVAVVVDITDRKRAELLIRGFINTEFVSEHYSEFLREIEPMVATGRIRYLEHMVDGLDAAPSAFIGMLEGRNLGKVIVEFRA